ncbi:hypothetical protein E2C01_086423 [Portunus trituberculatus]|uniref:Uncharacterized protein n=1 Tax=Portunus trituberculatus TaxID=210409 RepID=A0A5B7JEJ3_PORTR|nr:hypothetical protein [Portunus trituberculatus]
MNKEEDNMQQLKKTMQDRDVMSRDEAGDKAKEKPQRTRGTREEERRHPWPRLYIDTARDVIDTFPSSPYPPVPHPATSHAAIHTHTSLKARDHWSLSHTTTQSLCPVPHR